MFLCNLLKLHKFQKQPFCVQQLKERAVIMRILHDYNYDDLGECLYDLFRDISEYHLLCNSLNQCRLDYGISCLANDLNDKLKQHIQEFDSVFGRINRGAVPPEGEEPFEACFYPKQERELFNTPRIVTGARKAG